MPAEGLETTAGEQPQTQSLDHVANGKGEVWFTFHKYGSV